jgi:hypothetical protein
VAVSAVGIIIIFVVVVAVFFLIPHGLGRVVLLAVLAPLACDAAITSATLILAAAVTTTGTAGLAGRVAAT